MRSWVAHLSLAHGEMMFKNKSILSSGCSAIFSIKTVCAISEDGIKENIWQGMMTDQLSLFKLVCQ